MAKKKNSAPKARGNPWGSFAFVIAVVLAVVLGALQSINISVAALLVILGLIIGFLNITCKESKDFITFGAVMVIVSALGAGELSIIPAVKGIFDGLLFVFVPATTVVALKEMLEMAWN